MKKESGPRRAVAGLSGRNWLVEILKLAFKVWSSRVLRRNLAFAVHQSPSQGYVMTAPHSGEPFGVPSAVAFKIARFAACGPRRGNTFFCIETPQAVPPFRGPLGASFQAAACYQAAGLRLQI